MVLPVVTALDPQTSIVSGGQSVIITGTNLTGATAVFFDVIPAESFVVNSATQITAIAPPDASGGIGSVNVTVVTPGGVSQANNSNLFFYVRELPAPTYGANNLFFDPGANYMVFGHWYFAFPPVISAGPSPAPKAWLLGGNTDAGPGGSYLGTSNGDPLQFGTNDLNVLTIDALQNVAWNTFSGTYDIGTTVFSVTASTNMILNSLAISMGSPAISMPAVPSGSPVGKFNVLADGAGNLTFSNVANGAGSAWLVGGNSGLSDPSVFGTTSSAGINFQTNSVTFLAVTNLQAVTFTAPSFTINSASILTPLLPGSAPGTAVAVLYDPVGQALYQSAATPAGSFWSLTGNAGTTPGPDFVGTTDEQAFYIQANGNLSAAVDTSGNFNVIGELICFNATDFQDGVSVSSGNSTLGTTTFTAGSTITYTTGGTSIFIGSGVQWNWLSGADLFGNSGSLFNWGGTFDVSGISTFTGAITTSGANTFLMKNNFIDIGTSVTTQINMGTASTTAISMLGNSLLANFNGASGATINASGTSGLTFSTTSTAPLTIETNGGNMLIQMGSTSTGTFSLFGRSTFIDNNGAGQTASLFTTYSGTVIFGNGTNTIALESGTFEIFSGTVTIGSGTSTFTVAASTSITENAPTINIGNLTTSLAINIGNASGTTTIDGTTLKVPNLPTLATEPPFFLVLNGSNQVEQYALAALTNSTSAFLGQGAGTASGSNNVGVGFNVLHVNTGSDNVGIGFEALLANTSGSDNTAGGYGSMANNTSGSSNTAYGYSSLLNNTSANDNSAFGYAALSLNTTGALNAAFGAASLQSMGSGSNNSGFGTSSLINVLTGSYNTALGYSAGSNYTGSESNNLCLGANVLGTAGESNVIRIGNSTQTAMYVYGPASQSAATAALITTTAPSTVQPAGWVTMIYNPTTQQVGYYTQV